MDPCPVSFGARWVKKYPPIAKAANTAIAPATSGQRPLEVVVATATPLVGCEGAATAPLVPPAIGVAAALKPLAGVATATDALCDTCWAAASRTAPGPEVGIAAADERPESVSR